MQRTNKRSIMKFLLIGSFLLFQNTEAAIDAWTVPDIKAADGAAAVTTSIPEKLPAGNITGINISATPNPAKTAVTYGLISQKVQGMFTIDESTGAVTLAKGVLDFETTPTYWINVMASTGAGANGTANITLDVGNSPPVFKPTAYSKEVCDGAKAGTTVETVKAEDPGNTKVTYTLSSGTTNFTIGSTTGVIKIDTAKTLNMTVTKSYNLTVTATDTVTPTAGVGTATVSVNVKVCSGGTSAIAIAYAALLLSIIVNRL